MKKIYLDNCCYNRPYDDQGQTRISIEAQSKMHIQTLIREDRVSLITSYVLLYELGRNPHISARDNIGGFIEDFSTFFVGIENSEEVEKDAETIMRTGIKKMDALHIASAIKAGADYFFTTDDRLLKFKDNSIRIMNPVEFIQEEDNLL